MSTTYVPPPNPLNPEVTLEMVLEEVHNLLREAQGDEDKSSDYDDHTYYSAQVNAYQTVQDFLTLKNEEI